MAGSTDFNLPDSIRAAMAGTPRVDPSKALPVVCKRAQASALLRIRWFGWLQEPEHLKPAGEALGLRRAFRGDTPLHPIDGVAKLDDKTHAAPRCSFQGGYGEGAATAPGTMLGIALVLADPRRKLYPGGHLELGVDTTKVVFDGLHADD